MSGAALEPISKTVPIGLVDEPTLMSRAEIRDEDVEELAADIRANGLINPIAVVANGERYTTVAGHTRLLACRRAGLVEIDVRVYPTVEYAAENIKFSENRFRRDLSPAEEAIWFAELLEQRCGGDVDRLCGLLKIDRAYAERRLLLIQGDAEIFAAVKDRKIPLGVAEALNTIDDEMMRRYYLHEAIRGGATIAAVRNWVNDWKANARPSSSTPAAAAPAPVASSSEQVSMMWCYVCRKILPGHIPMPVNVHEHCRIAILDHLLDSYHGA